MNYAGQHIENIDITKENYLTIGSN